MKVVKVLVLVGLLVISIGTSVYAGKLANLSSSGGGSYYQASIINATNDNRYATISIYKYDGKWSGKSFVASNAKVLYGYSDSVSTDGKVTEHARAYGNIYNSSAPASGVAESMTLDIK